MQLFPAFLKLERRPCLVVGAGAVGESKLESLLRTGARVRVVAPKATRRVRELAREGRLVWAARSFAPSDLEAVFLVIAATSSRVLHQKIFREAQRRGVLCNVVDDPVYCDFFYPAVVCRGPLQIAVSTGGRSPALAQRLRRELESQFGPEYAGWVEQLGEVRKRLATKRIPRERRRRLLHRLASPQALARFILSQKERDSSRP